MDFKEHFAEKLETIQGYIQDGRFLKVREELVNLDAVDIEMVFDEIPRESVLRVFRMLPKTLAADTFSYMKSDMQQYIIESVTDLEMNRILDEMYMDDTVDFLEEMPANVVKRVLKNADAKTRNTINQLLRYPEGSAGSIMTTEFVELKKEMMVKDALSHIRATGVDSETINTCYVIDSARKLEGAVSIRKIILSASDTLISEIMTSEVKHLHTADDRETGAYRFKKYDLLSMPVVDAENRLVGIITIDDIVDVIEQETTEDIELMAAITPTDKPYIETNAVGTFKKRIFWLLILMLSATFTGGVLSSYESSLALYPALVSFIPMLMGAGGNAGGQTSVAVIRSLALNEISFSDTCKILWKELRVSLLCGAVMGVVCFFKVLLIDARFVAGVDAMAALVVSLTIFLTIVIAKLVGGFLPLLAKRVGFDPAVMASPFITTIVDALSLIVYFQIVRLFLPL